MHPPICELDAITSAAVSYCDGLDGVVDGLVTDIEGCLAGFNPFELVGTTTECLQTGGEVSVSMAAATIANGTWTGGALFPGYPPNADLTGTRTRIRGIAATQCPADGECVGSPQPLSIAWMLLLAKDLDFDLGSLTDEEFVALVSQGATELGPIIATNDADLSPFRDAGGKLISFHGLVSQTQTGHFSLKETEGGDIVNIFHERMITYFPFGPREHTTKTYLPLSPTRPTSTGITKSPAWPTASAVPAPSPAPCSSSFGPGSRRERFRRAPPLSGRMRRERRGVGSCVLGHRRHSLRRSVGMLRMRVVGFVRRRGEGGKERTIQ